MMTAAAAAAVAAGLKVKAGDLTVQMLVSSLHMSRKFSLSSVSTWKRTTTSSSSSSFPRVVFHRQHQRSWTQFAPFCTAAPNAGEAVSTDEPENKSEEAKEENVKDTANLLDIRVGRIVKAWRHEEAESLYVEEVDVGEAEPRIICSGLVKYVPLDLLQDAAVVVLANLKPRNMRGVKSFGMLLAASDAAHEIVELLVPPEGAVPGDRAWFGTEDDLQNLPEPSTPNQIQKKKIWESVQPHLKTDADGIAMLGPHLMRTPSGMVTSKSLKNAHIS